MIAGTPKAKPSQRSGASTPVSADAAPLPIVDVWSRTMPKYRRRAVLLLLVNAVLFAGLCCFSYWLRTGRLLAMAHDGYWSQLWHYFRPTGETQFTLSDLLVFPINFNEVPFQILILGLLLAALISIPICVAILYRFPFSLIFIGMIGFVAMMPWLAVTLLISCKLATSRQLRFPFRYASALLGLLPVVIYFVSATREPSSSLALSASPADQVKFYAPWIISFVASCLMMGIMLLCAWIVNYRPGAIAPMMALTFAVPVILFENKVGRDELYYRLLEHNYGRSYFADIDANRIIRRIAEQQLRHDAVPDQDLTAVMNNIKLLWGMHFSRNEIDDRQSVFAQQQDEAIQAYDAFLASYLHSRYVPNVLYFKALALDMRIDVDAFHRDMIIHYYSDFPAESSANTWRTLVEQFPEALPTAVARIRLAQLVARNEKIDDAIHNLDLAIERIRLEIEPRPTTRPKNWTALLDSKPASSTLGLNPESLLLEARRLRSFLARNNRDPRYGNLPLASYMRLDPHYGRFGENLRRLDEQFPAAKIAEDIAVQLANLNPSLVWRIRRLRELTESRSIGPAVEDALYYLGAALQADFQFEEARAAFEQLRSRFPDSVWGLEAAKRLDTLRMMQSSYPRRTF